MYRANTLISSPWGTFQEGTVHHMASVPKKTLAEWVKPDAGGRSLVTELSQEEEDELLDEEEESDSAQPVSSRKKPPQK